MNGAHSDKVDVYDSKDVPPDQLSMLLNKLFIPKTRAYELILSRLASPNLIVRVDE